MPQAPFHSPVLICVLLLKMHPSLPASLCSHTWKLLVITYQPTVLIRTGKASWQWSAQAKAVSRVMLP